SAARATVMEWYMKRTGSLHKYLNALAEASFPDEWKRNRKAYEAGQWTRSDTRQGGFLARAIVWKLQVDVHRDSQDEPGGICICFNGGSYMSAEKRGRTGIVFPDLGLIFEYPPGAVIVFRSADLYHGIIPWKPTPELPNHNSLTPGRFSYVFFNQGRAMDVLSDKPAGWGRKNAFGR
ncbi:hypothetical protein SISNIDRAFT_397745, partial [Sistotremastrum niveocremeum HHB9708]